MGLVGVRLCDDSGGGGPICVCSAEAPGKGG